MSKEKMDADQRKQYNREYYQKNKEKIKAARNAGYHTGELKKLIEAINPLEERDNIAIALLTWGETDQSRENIEFWNLTLLWAMTLETLLFMNLSDENQVIMRKNTEALLAIPFKPVPPA